MSEVLKTVSLPTDGALPCSVCTQSKAPSSVSAFLDPPILGLGGMAVVCQGGYSSEPGGGEVTRADGRGGYSEPGGRGA